MSEQPIIDAAKSQVVYLPDEVQYAEKGIVSRTVFKTATVRQVLFGFDAGQELTEHTSTMHALIQVLEGECCFTVRNVDHSLKSGSLLHMPPQEPHAVKAKTRFSMLLTLFKTPDFSIQP